MTEIELGESEDGAIDVDVLAAGEDGIEARAERDEGPDPAAHLDPPGIRLDEAVAAGAEF